MMHKNSGFIICFFLCVMLALACNGKKGQPGKNDTGKKDTLRTDKPENFYNPYAQVDISPMDMSYFPPDYPILKMDNPRLAPPVMRVIYSRPHLQGRRLFQNLLKYNEPWRLGANEATEIQFFRNVTIQKTKVPAGRYIMYCIPEPDRWTLVLNSNTDTWGLKMVPEKDLFRFTVPIARGHPSLEYFTMVFQKTETGANLLMAWDDIVALLPIEF
jgi:hypothetical protein